MKRIIAAIIDIIIIYFINNIIYDLMITVWRFIRNYTYEYLGSYSRYWIIALYAVAFVISMFVYYGCLEIRLKKKSFGKRIVKYEQGTDEEAKDIRTVLVHIGFRVLAVFLYPITLLYFLFTGKMIYDRFL